MKAMVLEAYNSPLVLKDVPTPKPGPREVLIKVDACGAGLTLHHSLRGTNKAPLPITASPVAASNSGTAAGVAGCKALSCTSRATQAPSSSEAAELGAAAGSGARLASR